MSLREQLKLWNRNQAGVIDEADCVLQEVTQRWPRELSYQILAPYLCPRLPRAELMRSDLRFVKPHHIQLDIDSHIIKIFIFPHLVKCELGEMEFQWAFTQYTTGYSPCSEMDLMPGDDQLAVVRDLVEGLLLPFLFLYDNQLHVSDTKKIGVVDFVCLKAKRLNWASDCDELNICSFYRAPVMTISVSTRSFLKLNDDTLQRMFRMFSFQSMLEESNRFLGVV